MENDHGMITYKRYALRSYYGPLIDEDREEDRRFHYMLSIPYLLGRDQKRAILEMISLFKKTEYPDIDNVELVAPDNPYYDGFWRNPSR